MTTNDNDTHDSELKPYLEGEDGVSALYRQAGNEMPPPDLDARIMRVAHAAVQGVPVDRRSVWHGVYQLAASFAVGILVASLYLERPDELATTQEVAIPVNVSFSPQLPPPPAVESAPAMENELSAENTRAAENTPSAENDTATESEPAEENVPAAQSAPEEKAVNEIASAVESLLPLVEAARVPEIAGAESAGRAGIPVNNDAPDPVTVDLLSEQEPVVIANAALEEITVTGSRIRTQPAFSYRDDRNAWQAEILRLAEEVSAAAAELETRTARLEEERALFLQTFPDATPAELSR